MGVFTLSFPNPYLYEHTHGRVIQGWRRWSTAGSYFGRCAAIPKGEKNWGQKNKNQAPRVIAGEASWKATRILICDSETEFIEQVKYVLLSTPVQITRSQMLNAIPCFVLLKAHFSPLSERELQRGKTKPNFCSQKWSIVTSSYQRNSMSNDLKTRESLKKKKSREV